MYCSKNLLRFSGIFPPRTGSFGIRVIVGVNTNNYSKTWRKPDFFLSLSGNINNALILFFLLALNQSEVKIGEGYYKIHLFFEPATVGMQAD